MSVSASLEQQSRSSRLDLRITPIQEYLLKQAAAFSHLSLTDFILASACLVAEQTLRDQRLFIVSGQEYKTLLDLFDQPP